MRINEQMIEENLSRLIPPERKGYNYLKMAIFIAMEEGNVNIRGDIAPKVVQESNLKSVSGLVSSMKRAINEYRDTEEFSQFFGRKIDWEITPRDFIEMFIERLNED